jgi:hypothetical protein
VPFGVTPAAGVRFLRDCYITDCSCSSTQQDKVLGRKRIVVDRLKIRAMRDSGESLRQIASKTGVSKSLVANILREQVQNDQR